jgi:hypothetical protein
LEKRDPGKINLDPHREQIEQCHARCSGRLRAIEEQKIKVASMESAAGKRVRAANRIPETLNALLREMDSRLEAAGAIGHLLESLYSDLQDGDLLDSGVGYFVWPLAPGVATDPQSRLSLWRKEAAQHGYDFKSNLTLDDLIEQRRNRLSAAGDELRLAMIDARGLQEPERGQRLQTLRQREIGLKAAQETLAHVEKVLN